MDVISPSHDPPSVLLQHGDGGVDRWWLYRDPVATFAASRTADVLPLLAEVEAGVGKGYHAAGFLAYEAASAFDPALAAHPPGALPIAWWGLFAPPREVAWTAPASTAEAAPLAWRPLISQRRYRMAIRRIRERIAAGDTYQVNYTFPLETPFQGDPMRFFAALCGAQRSRFCAYVDLGRFAVCSASPELFFELDGERITTRPMKGTARRGRWGDEDLQRSAALAASAKDRAENLMIVDMMRNDLGKIARPGSVRVEDLFAVETYPTLHQLTSTVSATTGASFREILRALFPCASITGAPKVRTSEIIRQLESGPRGIYTGSIGSLAPGRRARLNVAIRTATVDREAGVARYGTGGGIVWDSDAASEYEECRTKALVLTSAPPPFALLETLSWRPKSGYFLLERHLARLLQSARYFDYPVRAEAVRSHLLEVAEGFTAVRHRVRLLADRDGGLRLTAEPQPRAGRRPWVLVLDDRPIDSADPFLFHKTTHRRIYDEARQRHPEADEVVLWNERGELTEATRANLAVKIDGRWWTPPLASGLLAGTYRAELLERGRLREKVLPVEVFHTAREIRLINSVRGWIRTQHGTAVAPAATGEERSRPAVAT